MTWRSVAAFSLSLFAVFACLFEAFWPRWRPWRLTRFALELGVAFAHSPCSCTTQRLKLCLPVRACLQSLPSSGGWEWRATHGGAVCIWDSVPGTKGRERGVGVARASAPQPEPRFEGSGSLVILPRGGDVLGRASSVSR